MTSSFSNPYLTTDSIIDVQHGGTNNTTYTDGQLLIGNSSNNELTKATLTAGNNITITNGNGSIEISSTGGSVGSSLKWVVKDVKTNGTNGGTITSASWNIRTLNTLSGSADTSVTLNSNLITFTPGTYYIYGWAPAYNALKHKIRLYDTTNSITRIDGTSCVTDTVNNAQTDSKISDIVTFANTSSCRIEHWCNNTKISTGLGLASGAGTNEVYTTIFIEKIA